MSEHWQPIETAPKDKRTIILGYKDGMQATVFWYTDRVRIGWTDAFETRSYWVLAETGDSPIERKWEPTHWKDLGIGPNGDKCDFEEMP